MISRRWRGTTRGRPRGRPETGERLDPELAHKVVHACMNSERITEDEKLRLLEELMR